MESRLQVQLAEASLQSPETIHEVSPCQRLNQCLGSWFSTYLTKIPYQLSLAAVCILIILFLLLCLQPGTATTSSHPFQFCGASRSGHAIAVPNRVRCIPPEADHELVQTAVKIWTPRAEPLTFSAYKCTRRTRTICTNMGFFGSKGIVADVQKTQHTTDGTCRQFLLNTSNKFRLFSLSERYPGVWITNNTLTVEYSWCCTDHCKSVRNLIIEKGQIATFDGRHLSSVLGDIGGCHARSGVCFNTDSTIVWEP